MQHCVIKFVSDLRNFGDFLHFPPPIHTERHNITEILLKLALNTMTLPYPKLEIVITGSTIPNTDIIDRYNETLPHDILKV